MDKEPNIDNASAATPDLVRLTRQDREFLKLLAEGLSEKEIAARFDISPLEVGPLEKGLLGKLSLQLPPTRESTIDLASFAMVSLDGDVDRLPILEAIESVIPDHESWLDTPNPLFELRRPADLIREGDEEPIREILRAAVYIGVS